MISRNVYVSDLSYPWKPSTLHHIMKLKRIFDVNVKNYTKMNRHRLTYVVQFFREIRNDRSFFKIIFYNQCISKPILISPQLFSNARNYDYYDLHAT